MQRLIDWIKSNIDLVIIMAIGSFLRIYQMLKYEIWYDEAFTGLLMRAPNEQFLKILSEEPHPSLYYYLMRGWTYLVGVDDLTLRLPSVVFGILTILVIYFATKKLFNKNAAAIAALLAAVNPFMIAYSYEARSYALWGFLAAVALLLLVHKRFFLFSAALAVMLFVHYMFALFIPAFTFLYLVTVLKVDKQSKTKAFWFKSLLPIVLFLAGALYFYMPVYSGAKSQHLSVDWIRTPQFANIPRSITAYSYGIKSKLAGSDTLMDVEFVVDEHILGSAVFSLYILGLVGVIIKDRKNIFRLGSFMGIVLLTLLPMFELIVYYFWKDSSLYVERYLFPASIFYVISLGYMISNLLTWELMGITVVFYLFTLSRITNPGYYDGMKALVSDYSDFQGEIVFTSPIDYTIGKYYLNSDKAKLYDPRNPDLTYDWWAFMENNRPEDLSTAIIISADEGRMTPDFKRPFENLTAGDYVIYLYEPVQE